MIDPFNVYCCHGYFFSVRFLSMCKLEQHSIVFDGLAHMVGDNENRTV